MNQLSLSFQKKQKHTGGLVLCKYGIEYVDDPATGKKIPTCHRSSFDSVLDDPDFEQALENADITARKLYREEAKFIEDLRKNIIDVSEKEQPYDIFICYKETDENGERTIDSVIAQDVYEALTDKGYRVFFSRVTLEDKLGQEYEPYIFAALNSAKIMLVFGTDYEYFNAVWVKNEWSRYLKMMAKNKSKHLIPCYKDIDAYDLPKEFVRLQAQNMGKVGAIQDLIHGIDKLTGRNKEEKKAPTPSVIQPVVMGGTNATALLQRGFMSLEDGAFKEANTYFDNALNEDAENATAYLGLFMAQNKIKTRTVVREIFIENDDRSLFEHNNFWKRTNQFASGELLTELKEWEEQRNAKLECEEKLTNTIREKRNQLILQYKKVCREPVEMTPQEKEEQKRLTEEANLLTESLNTKKTELENLRVQDNSLSQQIEEKKDYIKNLGIFFKRNEKRQAQEVLAELTVQKDKTENYIKQKASELENIKQKVEEVSRKNDNYSEMLRENRKNNILEKLGIKDGYISFGRYEQGDGIKPIEWLILKKEDSKALLISKYALDYKKFDEGYDDDDSSWEKCSLRKWLNKDFFYNAFEKWERDDILLTTVLTETEVASRDDDYHICRTFEAPTHTQDYVFLLDTKDAKNYFLSENESNLKSKLLGPTVYAKGKYNLSGKKGAGYSWWLRTYKRYTYPLRETNGQSFYSVLLAPNGEEYPNGSISSIFPSCSNYVRPVIWINLDI